MLKCLEHTAFKHTWEAEQTKGKEELLASRRAAGDCRSFFISEGSETNNFFLEGSGYYTSKINNLQQALKPL